VSISEARYRWIMFPQRSLCAGVILLYRVLHDTLPPHVSLFDSSLTAPVLVPCMRHRSVSSGSPCWLKWCLLLMPSMTDGVLYGVHVWCLIVNDVL